MGGLFHLIASSNPSNLERRNDNNIQHPVVDIRLSSVFPLNQTVFAVDLIEIISNVDDDTVQLFSPVDCYCILVSIDIIDHNRRVVVQTAYLDDGFHRQSQSLHRVNI